MDCFLVVVTNRFDFIVCVSLGGWVGLAFLGALGFSVYVMCFCDLFPLSSRFRLV